MNVLNSSAAGKGRSKSIKVSVGSDKLDFTPKILPVVTPAPVCIERQESVFSVTGFLTFVVVASTAVANVIANIGKA